ncbi:MAG: ferritin-like domain-containing protein [Gaiellaceae bacterium]
MILTVGEYEALRGRGGDVLAPGHTVDQGARSERLRDEAAAVQAQARQQLARTKKLFSDASGGDEAFMSADSLDEQLVEYLADAHSIEEQALQQLRGAPEAAGDPDLARIFREHLTETEGHERTMRSRLDAYGERSSALKDLLMRVGGMGFLLFAKAQPDTPGKLVAHAYSYEHLELASYELLLRVAERAGDVETVEAAQRIRDEERAMAERLAASFDGAVEASLLQLDPEDLREQLRKYLADAHAIEAQATKLLEQSVDDPALGDLYREHLAETHRHTRVVEDRLNALGGDASSVKDNAMRAGGLSWATFFETHPDTPGKLAAFAYAFEHLEIAAYEELKRVANKAGDPDTVRAADDILAQERAAAAKIAAAFDRAAEAALVRQ